MMGKMKPIRKPKRMCGAFGQLVRRKRRALEMSLEELAKHCKLDAASLSRIEQGQRKPPEMPRLIWIAEKLGIPLESPEFAVFLEAADRDRNPELHWMAKKMRGGSLWNPFAIPEEKTVVCESLAELVSKAAEKAITSDSAEIVVRSSEGQRTIFRLAQEGEKSG